MLQFQDTMLTLYKCQRYFYIPFLNFTQIKVLPCLLTVVMNSHVVLILYYI